MKRLFFRPVVAAFVLLVTAGALTSCAPIKKPRVGVPPICVMPSAPSTSVFYHTVERKQTLYRISKMYRVELRELMRVNHISDASQLETGQRLLIPGQSAVVAAPISGAVYSSDQVRRLVGGRDTRSTWHTITVHHSGTLQGGAAAFNRDHLRRHMGGLFYHFVIGNGTQSRDGQIEVGWRWKKHVKANRPFDIQICLVGDFNQQRVSDAQYASLVTLIQTLRADYCITVDNVRRHEDIPGKHTACPGDRFPFSRLIQELS